jgi:hypothetical protein
MAINDWILKYFYASNGILSTCFNYRFEISNSVIKCFTATGLQLFIAKDGTTALGSHEVKSQMPAGVFKQVVMEENNR